MVYFFIIILVAVFFILVRAAGQPNEFHVTRSMRMQAAPEAVFAEVNNLRRWQAWSPWVRMEPTAATTFAGPEAGVGANMNWVGKKTGTGSMTITESDFPRLVRFRIDFLKPMKATNTAEFNFTLDGNATIVTWSMYGANSLVGKVVNVVMNCDRMVGNQFEQGLGNLRQIVEKTA